MRPKGLILVQKPEGTVIRHGNRTFPGFVLKSGHGFCTQGNGLA
jgi:hypothetical protein